MEFVLEEGKKLHDECATLLLPALSIGNVGQLAIDLLVSTTRAEKVGCFDDCLVVPCVGNDPYGPVPCGELAAPIEAYESISKGLTLIQQRSSVLRGRMIEFAKHLADFAASSGKKHVIVLSSLDFTRWRNIEMLSGPPIFYLSSTNADGSDADCERLGWKRLQHYNPSQRCWEYLSTIYEQKPLQEDSFPFEDDDDMEEEDYIPSLPFAALFSSLKAKGLKVTCLLCYCSEGDNSSDAVYLAQAASKLVDIHPEISHGKEGAEWIIPLSWNAVYGPPPDMSIF